MSESVKEMIREWVRKDRGDTERTARWMRDTLRLGSITQCRAWIVRAMTDAS